MMQPEMGPPMPPEMMGGMGGMAPPPPDAPEELSFEDRMRRMVDDARALVSEDGVDADEEVILEQLTSLLAKIKAKRAKEHQAALGGGPATNFLARTLGG